MLHPDFDQLGLTETEGKVYLALLELGGGFVSTIARRAQLPRVNCYHTLSNLVNKGLVSSIARDRGQYFTSEPPQVIVNTLEEKARYAKKILPELLSITNALALKPKIKYFEGMEGLRNILDDTLTAEKDLLGYSNLKAFAQLFGDYIPIYAAKRMAKKIKTRIICPSSAEAFTYTKKFYPKNYPADLLEILFVNPKEFWFEHEILIYGNKVAIISLDPDEQVGILFESSVYANSQRAIFNLAWLGASSFIAL